MRNTTKLVMTGAIFALIIGTGCTATATVGTSANSGKSGQLVGASVGKDGVGITLPFLKAGVAPAKED